MEAVLSILVLAVIYSVVFVVKSLTSKNPGVEAKPLMGEVFPEIKIYGEPLQQREEVPQIPVKKELKTETAARQPAPAVATPAVEKKGKFAIKGRSEAKKAFIYSEIFNRKY